MLITNEVFFYSSDLNGNFEFYDDPIGLFFLLPYLEFIDKESRVFKNPQN